MAGAPFYHPCGGLRLRRRAWGDPLLPVVARSSVDCGNRGDRGGDHASRSARPATRVVSAAAPTLYPMSCRPIGARQASPDLGLITPPLGRCFTPAADLPGLGKSRMRVMRNLPVVPLCTACKQKAGRVADHGAAETPATCDRSETWVLPPVRPEPKAGMRAARMPRSPW